MKKLLPTLLLVPLLWGCEQDFRFNQEVVPRIILNSVINPDSTITADIFWSKRMDDPNDFRRVVGARVKLLEDGELILDVISADEGVKCSQYPKEGRSYTFTIDLDGYSQVSASTTVPARPVVDGCVIEKDARSQVAYRMGKISVDDKTNAVHVAIGNVAEYKGEAAPLRYSYAVNANAPLADPFNKAVDTYENSIVNSFDYYDDYIRVTPGNLDKLFPLSFAGERSYYYLTDGYDEWGWPEVINLDPDHLVIARAASREYDLYYKTSYLFQMHNTPGMFPVIFENITVHSNVKNGLGIFASYSDTSYLFEYED